jgi:hypothetical protein
MTTNEEWFGNYIAYQEHHLMTRLHKKTTIVTVLFFLGWGFSISFRL